MARKAEVAEKKSSERYAPPDLIRNYFRTREKLSSGVIEGLNNKARVAMRKSYGFRMFPVTELALYQSSLSWNLPTDSSDEPKVYRPRSRPPERGPTPRARRVQRSNANSRSPHSPNGNV